MTYSEIIVKDCKDKIYETLNYFKRQNGNYDYLDLKLSNHFSKEFADLINL